MAIQTTPIISRDNDSTISRLKNARRLASRPVSPLPGHEQVHGHSAVYQSDPTKVQLITPGTPAQNEIYGDLSGLQWITAQLSLPQGAEFNADKVQFTWQAVAAHNPVLRTVVSTNGDDISLVVRQDFAPIKSTCAGNCAPFNALSDSHPPHLVVRSDETDEATLTLHIPRLLVDDASLHLIEQDFIAFYTGKAFAEHAPFNNYISDIAARSAQDADEHWRAVLAGVEHDPSFLHGLAPRNTSAPSQPRVVYSATAEPDVLAALFEFEEKTGIERETLFEAAWAVVLGQHQSREEVVFMKTARDAPRAANQSVVGRMEVTFPVRAPVRADANIFDVLANMQDAHATSTPHAFVGMERIMAQASNALSVQSCIKVIEGPGGIPFTHTLPISVCVSVTDNIRLTLECDTDVPEAKVKVLLNHCLSALESIIIADTDATVADIELVGAVEQDFLLEQAEPKQPARESLVHTLVEHQAVLTPKRIALEDENGRTMTYAALNATANQVARRLSCGPGDIVPVCVNRSEAMSLIVCLLAVLKSGAAYVTLDPDYPVDRQRFIAKDVSAPFVLAEGRYAEHFETNVIEVEKLFEQSAAESKDNLHVSMMPESAVYIIYTSGSTGVPKGVILEHSAATNGLLSAPKVDGVRSLLFYNPVFSASQRTIFGTLAQGGCLCLASKESLTVRLSETLTKMNVNTIGVTSTTAALLSPESAQSLQRMTFIGEKVSSAVVDTWVGKVDVRVGYGLSECTQLNWTASLDKTRAPNNIGRPSDTTQSYVVLPGTTRLAPIMVPGELCLAGPQLARSYLNRPEETSRVFIDNPFADGRLYRTGDMAICLEDGSIEILGRIDMQVKIAGQRIEPSEVAAVIKGHDSVEAAAVVAVKLRDETTLVACLTLSPTAGPWNKALADDLRESASRTLPTFAVPSFWVVLDELPANSNGKVDFPALRRHVESLGHGGLVQLSQFGSSSSNDRLTEQEAMLRDIWASVLELDAGLVHLEDSFLGLGGSSIRAIKVATLCRERGWDLAVADIIRSQSLKVLAGSLVQAAPAQEVTPYTPFSLIKQASPDFAQYEDVYPSSPLQESLVAASLSGIPDYLYQRVYDIQGADIARLKWSLYTVYKRSAILRTTFLANGPSFVQAVMKHDLPWEEHSVALDEYKVADAERGVSLGESFIRFGYLPKQSLLVVTTHHALFDYWSNTFILDDATTLYNGGTPATRTPYSSFIRHLLSLNAGASQTFWSEYLSGASSTRLGITPSAKHVVETTLSVDPKPFLTTHSVTSGSLIYAAWALVLASHTASDDVTFATALSGRDVPVDQVQTMDGPALTTVPQRVAVNRSQLASEYVRAVQNGLWEMNIHSQHGMRNALRASGQSANLFDTLVNLLVQKQDKSADTEQLFQPYGSRPAWNTEYITLEALIEDDVYQFRLISDLQAERATFVLEQFVNAISAIISQPNSPLSGLEIMSAAEHKFIEQISPRITSYTKGYMHAPLEHIAATMPERIAVQWQSSDSVSYEELNSRANRLASILREKGVGPDVIVPLCLEKSVSMIVAILGVLKAGGAYAPMDPENPPERNSVIVSDVEAKIVLTDSDHAEIFTEMNVEVVFVEDLDLSGSWPNVPVPDLTTDNLAYIIYTSGSTGLPKGVLIPHSAVSVAIQSIIDCEGCDKSWRTLLFSNYVFDVSISDIFTALGSGATLCVAPTSALLSDLAGCINSMGVTQLFLTPTVAKLISPQEVPAVTKLILGGEPMTADLMATWASKVHLMNGYGPTEAAIFVMMATVPAGSNARIIGPPLKSVSAVILDKGDSLIPVPYGAIGELCVSGPQLARGYLKRPEVNAKAFVEYQGERLYRTGDLARWLPDGQIECFGRKDNQVKISGHRIELGEIESAILATDKVFNCVVAVAEMQGKPQLAAFVIINNSSDDSQDIIMPPNSYADEMMSISTGLSALPPYMVPKLWIPVSRFPLMPSGKADRRKLGGLVKALDAMELSRYTIGGGEDSGEVVEPETDEEKLHQEMWSTVLGVEKDFISATASFFSFGGDSISAINLVSLCRRAGYTLPVGDVLAFPVLREMATRMKPISDASKPAEAAIVYDVDAGVYDELERHGVHRHDIEAILTSGPGQAEFRVLGNEEEQFWMLHAIRPIPADLDFNRWQALTVKLTERNAILRTSYVMDKNGSWLQVVLKRAELDIETIHVQDEAEMERVIQEDWNRLFDVGKPFVRYRLLVLPDGRRSIMIKLDHGSYDGTLLRVFDSQFTAMAKAQTVEEPVPFNSFVDHVTRLDKSKTLAFWRQMLEGSDFRYPVESTRPSVTDLIMRKTDRRVDAYASQSGVTVPIVFQTAFTALLSRLSGRMDVSYDNLVTGRDVDMQDTQLINGTCANFIPFRCSFDSTTTVKELLKETQSLFWKTNENGTVSITDIFADLGCTREDVANKCLFLFQPFEPASGPVDHMRWLVMALSKVTQPVNYALMLEVFKTALGYNLRIKYDALVYDSVAINSLGDQLISIIEGMMAHSSLPIAEILGKA